MVELASYSEIDLFIYKLLSKRNGKTLLLIGKTADDSFNELAFILGAKLAEVGFNIHTGGGPNIANAMAEGAWSTMEKRKQPIENRVVFFYRYGGGSTNPRKGNISYCGESRSDVRKKMISSEKVCLLFGSEPNDEHGIAEEINIARSKGARIIPLARTGEIAAKQWLADRHFFESGPFSEKRSEYDILNNPCTTNDEITRAVIELADYLLVRNYE